LKKLPPRRNTKAEGFVRSIEAKEPPRRNTKAKGFLQSPKGPEPQRTRNQEGAPAPMQRRSTKGKKGFVWSPEAKELRRNTKAEESRRSTATATKRRNPAPLNPRRREHNQQATRNGVKERKNRLVKGGTQTMTMVM
jgi:hypothetical protein